jgi:hypothetical protein
MIVPMLTTTGGGGGGGPGVGSSRGVDGKRTGGEADSEARLVTGKGIGPDTGGSRASGALGCSREGAAIQSWKRFKRTSEDSGTSGACDGTGRGGR